MKKLGFALVTCLFCSGAFASVEPGQSDVISYGERQSLARIAKELTLVKNMVAEPEMVSKEEGTTKFQYSNLKSDLVLIINEIQTELGERNRVPRNIKQIKLNY